MAENELTREDLERIAKAVIEERLDSMKFTLKIDLGKGMMCLQGEKEVNKDE